MVDLRLRTQRKVGLPIVQIKYIAGLAKMTYAEVLERLQKLLNYVWDKTEFDMKIWIKKYVPKRTGQLQDALLESLEQSYIKVGIWRFTLGVINASKKYAEDVNAMNTMMVRHFNEWGYAYYYGHHGRILLNDPSAIGGFWDAMMVYSIDQIRKHIAIGKEIYFGKPGKANIMLRRMIE